MDYLNYMIQEVLEQKGYSDEDIRIVYVGDDVIINIKGEKEYEFARYKTTDGLHTATKKLWQGKAKSAVA